jgi:hypothetical protein
MRTGQTLLCKNLAIAFIYHEASVAPEKDDPEREEGGSCLKQINWLKFECWRKQKKEFNNRINNNLTNKIT